MKALTIMLLITALPLTLLAGGSRGNEQPGPAPGDTTDTTIQQDTAQWDDTAMQGDTTMLGSPGKSQASQCSPKQWSFSAWDRNGNGVIDSSEFSQGFKSLDVAQQMGLDTTGMIDTAQLKTAAFGLLDTNANGILDTSEYAGASGWLSSEAASGSGEIYGNSGEQQSMSDTGAAMLRKLDRDGDNRISRKEFDNAFDAEKLLSDAGVQSDKGKMEAGQLDAVVFYALDRNANGQLTRSEWERAAADFRANCNRAMQGGQGYGLK